MTGTRHSLMVGDALYDLVCVVVYCVRMLLVGVSSVTVPLSMFSYIVWVVSKIVYCRYIMALHAVIVDQQYRNLCSTHPYYMGLFLNYCTQLPSR